MSSAKKRKSTKRISAKGKPMTDMTPEEINRKLAEWAGIDGTEYFGRYGRSFDKAGYPPDYYRSNAAMDLLGVLVEREYTYRLQDDLAGCGHVLIVWDKRTSELVANSDYLSTIPAAICTAILELIERERKWWKHKYSYSPAK